MRVKACCGGVSMFNNVRVVIIFDMFLNPNFKKTTRFANIARTTASTSKLSTRKDFKLSGVGYLYEK